jgi:hypothetical protein
MPRSKSKTNRANPVRAGRATPSRSYTDEWPLTEIFYVSLFFFLYASLTLWRPLTHPEEIPCWFAKLDFSIHYAFKTYWVNSLKALNPALWNPYVTTGIPFPAHPSVGAFSPFNLLHLVFSPPFAFTLQNLAHVWLAAFGMYVLMKALNCRWEASVLAGLAFGFQGYFFLHNSLGLLPLWWAACWIPWVLYFLQTAVAQNKFHRILAASACASLSFFEGYPQITLYTIMLSCLFIFYSWASRSSSFWKMLSMSLLFVAGFLALAACQLLPASEFVRLSNRSGWGYQEIMIEYLRPSDWLCFLNPFHLCDPNLGHEPGFWGNKALEEMTNYIGLAPFFLFVIGSFLWGKLHRLHGWFTGMAVLFWLLAMGESTIFTKYLFLAFCKFVPTLSQHRNIGRMAVIATFCMAVVAGLALDWVIRRFLAPRKNGTTTEKKRSPTFLYWLAPALIALTAANLWVIANPFWSSTRNWYADTTKVFPRPFIDRVLDDKAYPRIQPADYTNSNILFKVAQLRSSDMTFVKEAGWIQQTYFDNEDTPITDLAAMKYACCLPSPRSNRWKEVEPEGHFVNEKAYPRAFLVGGARLASSAQEALAMILNGRVDPQKEVLLEHSPIPFEGKPAFLGAAEITRYEDNRVDLHFSAPQSCYLLLSDTFFPGWKASLNTKTVPIFRADAAFRAVYIPSAGEHHVEMVYRPIWLYTGVAVSFPAWVLLVYFWIRKRDKSLNQFMALALRIQAARNKVISKKWFGRKRSGTSSFFFHWVFPSLFLFAVLLAAQGIRVALKPSSTPTKTAPAASSIQAPPPGASASKPNADLPSTDKGEHPRMTLSLEFNGIKSKWGYSGWAVDGGANPSVNKGIMGGDLVINGQVYRKGIGTHAPSEIVFDLGKKVRRFSCRVGANETGRDLERIYFRVLADGKKLFRSPIMAYNTPAIPVDLDVTDVEELSLKVDYVANDSWGHADWVDIKFEKAE